MKQSIRILVVDDHPMTIKGYSIFLMNAESHYDFEIDSAASCDDVLDKMHTQQNRFYDIVLLDISLPPSRDKLILNGEDLGLRLKKCFPATKIIVQTTLNDQQRISNIFKTLNPEGFLIKSDLEPEILLEAVHSVLNDDTFYSERTNRLIGATNNDDLYIDSLNRKILYHISMGERMKDLPELIHSSMATIERRKKNMKILFDIPEGSEKQLLDIARSKGFI